MAGNAGLCVLLLAASLGFAAAEADPDDKLRTQFHFQPPKNWINDPNGPMRYNGLYHLFVQYNPTAAKWGNIVWAHAVSTDLLDWILLEPAISPSAPFDINGAWSGSATILPDGRPAIMYTGVDVHGRQVQNLAFPKNSSDPYLRHWVKPGFNPVITPGAGVNASAFRDPSTAWRGGDGLWRILIGSKHNRRGLVVLYHSPDFKHWTPARRPFHHGDTGMVECPDFFPVTSVGNVKHVLKVSIEQSRSDQYTLGTYDDGTDTYVPDDGTDGLRLDFGNFYASKTFVDPVKQRRVLWGWAKEADSTAADDKKGWAGVQAIPRDVWLARDGSQLMTWPVAEVETLRGNRIHIANRVVNAGDYFEILGLRSPAQADLDVEFQLTYLERAEPLDLAWGAADAETLCAARGADATGGVGPFGLWLLSSGDLRERTAVFMRVFKANGNQILLLCNDLSRSSYSDQVDKRSHAGFLQLDIAKAGGKISLRTLRELLRVSRRIF